MNLQTWREGRRHPTFSEASTTSTPTCHPHLGIGAGAGTLSSFQSLLSFAGPRAAWRESKRHYLESTVWVPGRYIACLESQNKSNTWGRDLECTSLLTFSAFLTQGNNWLPGAAELVTLRSISSCCQLCCPIAEESLGVRGGTFIFPKAGLGATWMRARAVHNETTSTPDDSSADVT